MIIRYYDNETYYRASSRKLQGISNTIAYTCFQWHTRLFHNVIIFLSLITLLNYYNYSNVNGDILAYIIVQVWTMLWLFPYIFTSMNFIFLPLIKRNCSSHFAWWYQLFQWKKCSNNLNKTITFYSGIQLCVYLNRYAEDIILFLLKHKPGPAM